MDLNLACKGVQGTYIIDFPPIVKLGNDREHLYEALDLVAKGKVRVMNKIFSLEDISNAYEKVANGNVRFKAVVKPTK